ncbi:hypothetical protein BH20ACI4_BH20ACI4_22160 [soil metagenome]
MKTTKLTVKFFLIIALFASITMADDGQMGGGNFGDDGQMGGGNVTCTEDEGQMGGGNIDCDEEGLTDSVLIFVKGYLAKFLG